MSSSARSSESSTMRQVAPKSSQRSRSARVSEVSAMRATTAVMSGRHGLVGCAQPRVARRVLAGVVGVQVDEAALDLPVADLEHVAPPARAPVGDAGAPGPVLVLAVAGALAHDGVRAREDPVEVGVVVADRLRVAPTSPNIRPISSRPLAIPHLG